MPTYVSEHVLPFFGLTGVLVIVGFVVRGILSPPCDFRIRVRSGRVAFDGKFPASLRVDATRLLLEEMHVHRVTVRGTWTPHRVLRVRVSGRLEPGGGQRIRNYLIAALRP